MIAVKWKMYAYLHQFFCYNYFPFVGGGFGFSTETLEQLHCEPSNHTAAPG